MPLALIGWGSLSLAVIDLYFRWLLLSHPTLMLGSFVPSLVACLLVLAFLGAPCLIGRVTPLPHLSSLIDCRVGGFCLAIFRSLF